MKTRISFTIDVALLEAVDNLTGNDKSRSEVVESALRVYIARFSRESNRNRDLELIEKHLEAMNEEARDVLSYQADQ